MFLPPVTHISLNGHRVVGHQIQTFQHVWISCNTKYFGLGLFDEQVDDFLGRASPLNTVQEEASTGSPATRQRSSEPDPLLDAETLAQVDVPDEELAFSARAQPIPLRQSRAGSVSAERMAESMAASRRERQAMMSLSQSYRSRGVRDRQRVRRYSVTFDPTTEAPMAVAEPVLNTQAVQVVRRVRDKLTGHDFGTAEGMNVVDQVDKLIRQATAHENLATAFLGWCAFW